MAERSRVVFFMMLSLHGSTPKSRGLGQLLHWYTAPGEVVRPYYLASVTIFLRAAAVPSCVLQLPQQIVGLRAEVGALQQHGEHVVGQLEAVGHVVGVPEILKGLVGQKGEGFFVHATIIGPQAASRRQPVTLLHLTQAARGGSRFELPQAPQRQH